MCRRVDCSRCGRPSFSGCGRHVEQVLGDVARADRCQCHARPPRPRAPEGESPLRSWLRGLMGD